MPSMAVSYDLDLSLFNTRLFVFVQFINFCLIYTLNSMTTRLCYSFSYLFAIHRLSHFSESWLRHHNPRLNATDKDVTPILCEILPL
jgi:hypothetical protein